ncbi:MAG: bifunctional DNA-formamidopyrimidine glycosylase/DNA-(apurinic or apyrimidinic site) lyase [Planctomycetes bacterium]|nr:bifunctional DNA-formamidopyrimidine glycosylase/DNA-(apurinic or apyrimidinic site) lyase [Planctomycetota bacterium]
MPELPEIETVRRGVAQHLPGHRVERVALRRPDLRWRIPAAAVRDLVGRTCTGAERRSKYLLLPFDGAREPYALVHLGMSGRLFVDLLRPRGSEPDWQPHEHWRMRFAGGRLLRYVDPRRFGALDVVPSAMLASHPLLAALGPEPLGDDFDGAWLFARSRGRRVATKVFVMDAAHVVGVGNIYASESCFRAGIRPGRAAGRLTRAQCDALAGSIRAVLRDAIAAGGTTLRDYIGVDQDAGYFQRELAVYGRAGEPCPRCNTPIRGRVLGGRSTFYCPSCQR